MGVTWTDQQKKVIDLRDRNILVSAAAGSGKTAVLVERMIRMITDPDRPIDVDELLVVTFTKAAAAEMKERIGSALEKALEADPDNDHLEKQSALLPAALITTIDSFCLHVIRNHFNEIDLDPSFRVADETELTLLMADTMEHMLEDRYSEGDEAFLEFVEAYARGKTDQSIETLISQIYTYSRSYPWPDEWLDQCLEGIDVADAQALEDHPLIIFLEDYIRNMLECLCGQLRYAIELCAKPDGPTYYDEALASDICQLKNMLLAECFFDMKAKSDEISWQALSRKKMSDASDEMKKAVKAIRDSVKKHVNKIREQFFYTDAAHMVSDLQMTLSPMRVLIDLVKDFSERFQTLKAEKNLVDFADLEHFALNILVNEDEDGVRRRTDAAVEMSRQFVQVMCDEYQDSNLVQETILKAVSREEDGAPNIFMVGDVKQSIYRFRQARPELFMEKYNTYSLDDSLYQRVDLSQNFRSRDCVVDFVNLIFRHIMGEKLGGIAYDEHAALYCGATYPEISVQENASHQMKSGESESAAEINLNTCQTQIMIVDMTKDDEEAQSSGEVQADSEDDEENIRIMEARSVALQIRRLMAAPMLVTDKASGALRPLAYGDIVILLRSAKGWAETFTQVLMDESIPASCETTGGFFDTVEIRTAMSLLAVIDNPIQDIELAAVMKSCVGRFLDEEMVMIRAVRRKGSFYDACRDFLNEETDLFLLEHYEMDQILSVRDKLKRFMTQLARFRKMSTYMSIHQLIRAVFDETGYEQMMSAMPMGEQRRANLELLIEKAVAYEQTSYRGLFNFVRYISRLKTQNTEIGEASVLSGQEDAVRILSIHKSKGLEYPVVFVSGMCKKFNMMDIYSSILLHPDNGLGPEAVDTRHRVVSPTILKTAMAKKMTMETLSEELRILYVALTRAKERLILTGAVKNYQNSLKKWARVSAFMGEQLTLLDLLDAENYMDWVMPVALNKEAAETSGALITMQVLSRKDLLEHQALEEISASSAYRALEEVSDFKQSGESGDEEKTMMDAWADEHLRWIYPYEHLIHLPAKMTITEIKRMYEEEDSEAGTPDFLKEDWEKKDKTADSDKPVGVDKETDRDKADAGDKISADIAVRREQKALLGTAVHRVMELIDFTSVRRLSDVEDLIADCVINRQFSQEIADRMDPWKIFNLVRSDIGKEMARAQSDGKLHREYQFMMAVGAGEVFGLDEEDVPENEIILTQGVIDVWYETDEGITLLDYKTDYVPGKDTDILIRRYHTQLDYYQKALERATHQKVIRKVIYSFDTGKTVDLTDGQS